MPLSNCQFHTNFAPPSTSMGEPHQHDHEGRTIYLCCAGCVNAFEANADKMLEQYDQQIIEHQKEDYPLTVCVVSGEELGSHGAILNVVHDNTLVRLCCQGCLAAFERNPDTYMQKLHEAQDREGDAAPVNRERHHSGHSHGHSHEH